MESANKKEYGMNIGINMNAIMETAKMDRLGLVLQTMMNVFDEKSTEKAPSRGDLVGETERRILSAFSSASSVRVDVKCSTKVTSDIYCLTAEVRIPALCSFVTATVERKLISGVTGRTTSISVKEDITG